MNFTTTTIYQGTAYYRVSNDDGDLAAQGKLESNSISNQRSLIEDYLKDKPDIVLLQERIDDGFSGVDFQRPAFKQMIADVKAGKTNCIIVKDLSRFGRNYIEVGRFLEQIFPYLGVRFIAINDNYDSVTANNTETHLMVPFKNLMNDSYSRDLSTKVRSQFEIKRKHGEFIGSFAVYGYLKDKKDKNHLVIDEYAASTVVDIFKWKLEGKSNDEIAKKLNNRGVLAPAEYKKSQGLKYGSGFISGKRTGWSGNAVKRILTNQTYLGYIVQGKKTTPNHKVKKIIEKKPEDWIVVKDKHQPIISEEQFALAQKALQMDTRISPQNQGAYIFSGMVFCGDCEGNMVRKLVSAGKYSNGKARKYPYLICSTNKRDSRSCKTHMLHENALEEAVHATLKKHIDNVAEIKELIARIEQKAALNFEMKKLEHQILKVNEEISRNQKLKISLYEALTDGSIDNTEFFELKQHYTTIIEQCEQQILFLKSEQDQLSTGSNKKKSWLDYFMMHQNITILNREIVLKLIDRITVYEGGRIKVTFSFQYDYDLTLKMLSLYEAEGRI